MTVTSSEPTSPPDEDLNVADRMDGWRRPAPRGEEDEHRHEADAATAAMMPSG